MEHSFLYKDLHNLQNTVSRFCLLYLPCQSFTFDATSVFVISFAMLVSVLPCDIAPVNDGGFQISCAISPLRKGAVGIEGLSLLTSTIYNSGKVVLFGSYYLGVLCTSSGQLASLPYMYQILLRIRTFLCVLLLLPIY